MPILESPTLDATSSVVQTSFLFRSGLKRVIHNSMLSESHCEQIVDPFCSLLLSSCTAARDPPSERDRPDKISAIFNFHQRMSWLLAAVAAVISFWVISLARILSSSSCVPSDPGFLHSGFGKRRNVLLVIAHPDDESMFFTPTILFLKYGGHNIHILCMSTGNADGVGNTRKDEIYRACSILKVPLQQVKVLDHPGLQDGFNETWDLGLLAKLIQNEVRVWNIDLVSLFN
ncbi:hypothetical protein ZIOFF_012438 [Zingiber officinale]|uniref:N-acetylglucosaminylphosphatidylinositol deacetylase n=1 Tax=Zingiber officinale TaxID=94328 RepID=A0A8J5I9U8_ZINOF|nr:hypothetical protein ZIOFF_012438 [Zingiber officinale]